MIKSRPEICYLCGEKLGGDVGDDHVPPKQFYAERIRKSRRLDLFTLPVHKERNQAYMMDEEYFVHTLAPVVGDTPTGRALWDDLLPDNWKAAQKTTPNLPRLISHIPTSMPDPTCVYGTVA